MSHQKMHDYLAETINLGYFSRLLGHKNIKCNWQGSLIKIDGFNGYNHLIDLNSMLSASPKFTPIDRTGTTNHPFKWANVRPWSPPTQQLSLNDACGAIVKRLSDCNKPINVFWSGGIDSTAIVTAFLKYLKHKDQLRIVYSPWSCYEHPKYLEFLKNFNGVELINQSGELYLDLNLDGIFISGNSSDEIHASMDQSFLNQYGYDFLQSSWRDWFRHANKSDKFIDFCEQYFSKSGFDINTVFEARWFFYATCKIDSILRAQTVPFLLAEKGALDIGNVIGFFNCEEYEQYIYWNLDKIMPSSDYRTWKQPLKDFCFEFDGLEDWHREKTKFNSVQFNSYTMKKVVLNDQRYIAILENGERIYTDNLPFFSAQEFDYKYGKSLDYIVNDPD
jgi:hypothetical protein